ncbi:MAG: hypothetical protein DPW16_03440 [Chloroflexi bacterium]|nr:hypothetical protein [Chloroflexota bacterium]
MEKIIFIACLKTGIMFFVAVVFIRLEFIRSLVLDRRQVIVVSPHEYLTKTRFQEAFQSLSKNVKSEELHPYSVTLNDPQTYSDKRPIQRPRRIALVLFLTMFFLLGVSVVCWTVRDSLVIKGHEFYSWTSTTGEIQSVETRYCERRWTRLQFCSKSWDVLVNYTYQVNGITYDSWNNDISQWERFKNKSRVDGDQVPSATKMEIGEAEATAFLNNHAIGQEVLIIYDPQNPQDTILQRDINDYSDRPRNEDVRRYVLYGAYLSGILAGAVVFPAAFNLIFAQPQPQPTGIAS